MKIGISSTGNTMESALDPRFGRCAYFVIHDTDAGRNEFIENAARSASGGAGIAAAQQMIDSDVGAVITGNMGPNAFDVMKNAGIKVYRCADADIETALKLYSDQKLALIDSAGPAHAGMGQGGH
ncbi:MAG: NifB/NifX family molybdenum-iron cluster-binding protein [Eubacteriales bacterium]|nr:NifB/NifX family molybdenum-iron cluster-binding protein [Eubacteriales bacterium]